MTLGGKCGSPRLHFVSGPKATLSIEVTVPLVHWFSREQLTLTSCSFSRSAVPWNSIVTASRLALRLTCFVVLKHLQYKALLFTEKRGFREQTLPSMNSLVFLRSCNWSLNTPL